MSRSRFLSTSFMTCSLMRFISSYRSTMSSSVASGSYALSSWHNQQTHNHTTHSILVSFQHVILHCFRVICLVQLAQPISHAQDHSMIKNHSHIPVSLWTDPDISVCVCVCTWLTSCWNNASSSDSSSWLSLLVSVTHTADAWTWQPTSWLSESTHHMYNYNPASSGTFVHFIVPIHCCGEYRQLTPTVTLTLPILTLTLIFPTFAQSAIHINK